MDFMTAEEAKANSLINRGAVFGNIDIAAKSFLQEMIKKRVDHGVTRFILSGSSDDFSGVPFYHRNDDTKELLQVTDDVISEFRTLGYKVEVKRFGKSEHDPPMEWPGSYVAHLTVSWD